MADESLEILNAGFDFIRHGPPQIRTQFRGIPTRTLLSEGESLFRFLEPDFSGTVSDFWLPLETYHHLRLSESVPEWAVWRSTGSRAQRPSTAFCKATLRRKVYGFKGVAAQAGQAAITSTSLLGSGLVWIPGLSQQDFFLRSYSFSLPPAELP